MYQPRGNWEYFNGLLSVDSKYLQSVRTYIENGNGECVGAEQRAWVAPSHGADHLVRRIMGVACEQITRLYG